MNWGIQMAENDSENKELYGFFDAAKATPPAPSDALMARVLQDAVAAQPIPDAPLRARVSASSLWRDFLRAVGGWPAMAGLASAAVAGLWLGVAPPAALPGAATAYLSLGVDSYLVDAAPSLGFDLLEEAL